MKRDTPKKKLRQPAPKALAPAPSSPDLDRSKIAELYLYPHLKAANLILKAFSNTNTVIDPVEFQDSGPTEGDLLAPLLEEMRAVTKEGNMKGLEAMLVAQAHSLDALFFRLATFGVNQTERPNLLAVMGLAIRAQGACRATIETLSVVKNPPTLSFVRQANIASVQQVNSANAVPMTSPAKRSVNSPNKLMEVNPHETKRLDSRAPKAHASDDLPVETMEIIDWPEDRTRKGQGIAECLQRRCPPTPTSSRPGTSRVPRRIASDQRNSDELNPTR